MIDRVKCKEFKDRCMDVNHVMSGCSGQDEGTIASSKEVVFEGGTDDHEGPLPGFRFHPTDEELVSFYLKRKVDKKKPLSIEIIKHIDIYKHDPWDLAKCGSGVGDKEWYFYCKRGRKYRNSARPNRVTGSGFWKATGIDRPIYSNEGEGQQCVGLKKSLVYYRGSAGKGTKTDWMMHEFRLPADLRSPNKSIQLDDAEIWTLCRIFKRSKRQTPDRGELSVGKNALNSTTKPDDVVVDSNTYNHERYISFTTHQTTPTNTYTIVNESAKANRYAVDDNQSHCNSVTQSTLSASNSSSLIVGEDYENDLRYFYGGNWDDLNSVVEFAVKTPIL